MKKIFLSTLLAIAGVSMTYAEDIPVTLSCGLVIYIDRTGKTTQQILDEAWDKDAEYCKDDNDHGEQPENPENPEQP